MNLTEYAQQSRDDTRRWFPDKVDDLMHQTVALAGEVGEVANIVKKIDRGSFTLKDKIIFENLAEELIDVQIYLNNLYGILGINPDKVYAIKRAENEKRFGKLNGIKSVEHHNV